MNRNDPKYADSYDKHLNRYDVIYLDMTAVIGAAGGKEDIVPFAKSIRKVDRNETIRRVRESDQLIADTVQGNAEAVAAQIEKIHREETARARETRTPLRYVWVAESLVADAAFLSNEQALRSVIKLAYFSYKDHYLKFEELPSGDGYVDIVYFPKKLSLVSALVIELKWNQSAEGAIGQIRKKRYPEALEGYGWEILLVGISYDKEAKGITGSIPA